MRLDTLRRKGCGLMGAFYIISIAANAVWMMFMLRNQPTEEYYSPTAGLVASQCIGGRCAGGNCSPAPESQYMQASSQTAGTYAWDAAGPPWRLTQGGAQIGTLYANGSFIGPSGEAVPCPAGWYPREFDTTKLVTNKSGIQPTPDKTGDSSKPLFGVATKELDSSLQNKTAHYFTTDSEGRERTITRNDAFNSVGNPQLQSFYKGYSLAIIGIDSEARRQMVSAAKEVLGDTQNVTVCEYDPKNPADLWHIEGNWNHALAFKPTLASGGAVAYLTNGPQEANRKNEVMAWSPDEVMRAAKEITTSTRPRDGIPNHDPNKAKVDQPLFGLSSWPLTQYQTALALLIFAGAVLLFTPKPPAIEAN